MKSLQKKFNIQSSSYSSYCLRENYFTKALECINTILAFGSVSDGQLDCASCSGFSLTERRELLVLLIIKFRSITVFIKIKFHSFSRVFVCRKTLFSQLSSAFVITSIFFITNHPCSSLWCSSILVEVNYYQGFFSIYRAFQLRADSKIQARALSSTDICVFRYSQSTVRRLL